MKDDTTTRSMKPTSKSKGYGITSIEQLTPMVKQSTFT